MESVVRPHGDRENKGFASKHVTRRSQRARFGLGATPKPVQSTRLLAVAFNLQIHTSHTRTGYTNVVGSRTILFSSHSPEGYSGLATSKPTPKDDRYFLQPTTDSFCRTVGTSFLVTRE